MLARQLAPNPVAVPRVDRPLRQPERGGAPKGRTRRAPPRRRARVRGERQASAAPRAGCGDVEACLGGPELHHCYGAGILASRTANASDRFGDRPPRKGRSHPTASAGSLRRSSRPAERAQPLGDGNAEPSSRSLRAPRSGHGQLPATGATTALGRPKRRAGPAGQWRPRPLGAEATEGRPGALPARATTGFGRSRPRVTRDVDPVPRPSPDGQPIATTSGRWRDAGSREPRAHAEAPTNSTPPGALGCGTRPGRKADGALRRRRSSSRASEPVRRLARRGARPELGKVRDRASRRTER